MVLVVNLSQILKLFVLLCCCQGRPSARCGSYIRPSLAANIIWKSFLKYERCQCLKIAVSRASLIFQKIVLDAVSRYNRPCVACTSCTRSNIATTKHFLFENLNKKTTKTFLRCTGCTPCCPEADRRVLIFSYMQLES